MLYGLGSENANLPGYVVLCPGRPVRFSELWTSAFLPAEFQGTYVNHASRDPRRQRRKQYLPELTDVVEAVRMAQGEPAGLTVLADPADATTSGAPGDSTWVLGELLRYDWPRGAVVTIVAPEVVEQAAAAGSGHTLATAIGGRRDARFSRPLEISAVVERIFRAAFVLSGHLARNLPVDMGRCAVLRAGDVRIVVTSRSGPHFAPDLFRAAGIDPFAVNVLVAKSPCGFRAAYADRAARIVLVRAPGCAPTDFWNYPYANIPRPLWPWDDIDDAAGTPGDLILG